MQQWTIEEFLFLVTAAILNGGRDCFLKFFFQPINTDYAN
jgi:hypothetical protein